MTSNGWIRLLEAPVCAALVLVAGGCHPVNPPDYLDDRQTHVPVDVEVPAEVEAPPPLSIPDLEDAKYYFLKPGRDVNARDEDGLTVLHWAAVHGQAELIPFYLGLGANVDARGRMGQTPLHYAAVAVGLHTSPRIAYRRKLMGHYPDYAGVVRILLAHGASVSATDNAGGTPLHTAAFMCRREIAEILLSHGADINARCKDGLTPLGKALGFLEARRHRSSKPEPGPISGTDLEKCWEEMIKWLQEQGATE